MQTLTEMCVLSTLSFSQKFPPVRRRLKYLYWRITLCLSKSNTQSDTAHNVTQTAYAVQSDA